MEKGGLSFLPLTTPVLKGTWYPIFEESPAKGKIEPGFPAS